MRSKRPILVYCADPELLAATAFALRLHPYEVTETRDVKEALSLAAGNDATFAAAVMFHQYQGDPTGRLIHLLLESESRVSLLLVDRAGDLAPARYVDVVLYGRNTSTAHILSALEILCRRKRGPKPEGDA